MIGPHHLNEVFFDDVQVTEADVLGPVDEGWQVVQEVLAFERVGIARYARCERLLQAAPAVLGDQLGRRSRPNCGAGGPGCSRTAGGPGCWPTGWWRCRAGPGAAGRRRGLPDRGHQARPGQRRGADGDRRARAGCARSRRSGSAVRWRTTGATRRHPLSRREASRCSGSCWPGPCCRRTEAAGQSGETGRRMNIELSEEAAEFGRQPLLALEAAGGDQLVAAWPNWSPRRREGLVAPVLAELGAWELDPRGDAGELEAAAALCRSAGYWAIAVPGGRAARRARPISTSTACWWSPDRGPAAAVAGPGSALGGGDAGRPPQHRRRPSDRPVAARVRVRHRA